MVKEREKLVICPRLARPYFQDENVVATVTWVLSSATFHPEILMTISITYLQLIVLTKM